MAKKEDPIFELADEALDYVTSNKEVQYLHEQFQKRALGNESTIIGIDRDSIFVEYATAESKVLGISNIEFKVGDVPCRK